MPVSAAIATMTKVHTAQDRRRVLEALTALSETGYPVHVADGGSTSGFVSRVSRIPNVIVGHERGGLVRQVKMSMRSAMKSGAELVIYTEPDKLEFFDTGLARFVKRAASERRAAIFVGSRSPSSMATFPLGQRRIEAMFNRLVSDFFYGAGMSAKDVLYGPLILHRQIVLRYMREVPDDLGWGWRPYILARCIQHGHPVLFHTGRFPCPKDQRKEDDAEARLHRLRQLSDNVRGLYFAMSVR